MIILNEIINVTRSAKRGLYSLSKYPHLINHNSWSLTLAITATVSPMLGVCCCQILGLYLTHKSIRLIPYSQVKLCIVKHMQLERLKTPFCRPGHKFACGSKSTMRAGGKKQGTYNWWSNVTDA